MSQDEITNGDLTGETSAVERQNEQTRIRREKLEVSQKDGDDPFRYVSYPVDAASLRLKREFEATEGRRVCVAGRMMSRRLMGKASFIDVLDGEGRIQAYVRSDAVGPESYEKFKSFDIGDVVGVKGAVFKTNAGEVSVKADEIVLLSKSLRALPEKFHGLKDQELRYRQRYLDLIVNPEIKDVFTKRTAIIKSIRSFLDERGFLEVDTPVLQTFAGGGTARPFGTKHNALDLDMSLRIALELPLKKLIIGGMERVYELGRCFRNEGISTKHNPEFIMLELYEAYSDYNAMMELTEALVRNAALSALGTLSFKYGEHEIDLAKPFKKITMAEAVREHSGVDFDKIRTIDEARAAADKSGVRYLSRHGKGKILELFFDEFAEEHMIQPTFVLDHPVEISPLTKRKPDNPDYTERFELFIVGREHANAYSELNDPVDQRRRFEDQEQMKAAGDDEANMIDEEFIRAMEYGMPPTGGMGMGVERLIMLLTNSQSIRDVIFFPAMKPLS